ncbi:MAG: hypothetical protein IKB98_09815 [Clostridia bacterium]|nr:hypothetical protein [Clostridia bacterium]
MKVWKNSLKRYKVCFFNQESKRYYFSYYINTYNCLCEFSFSTNDSFIVREGFRYILTEENRKILLDKIEKFCQELFKARMEYEKVKTDCVEIYVNKIDNKNYHVIRKESSFIYVFKGKIEDFFSEYRLKFYKAYSHTTKSEDLEEKVYNKAIVPFLSLKDEYVVRLAKFISNHATKEDVDFLNEYEGCDRLFVDREVYGVEDITDIKNVTLSRRGSMFGWRISYDLECEIDGKYYKMQYYPSCWLKANCIKGEIEITDQLLDKIKALTGETENNIKTRKLMQLGNFLYCYDGSISRYSLEKQNKVFSEMSMVSLEDLKSLPKHWLEKLSKAQLYDWLKSAGYSGDNEANEFVEALLKERK